MTHFYIVDKTGVVTNHGTIDKADMVKVSLDPGSSIHEGTAELGQQLQNGALGAPSNTYLWGNIRSQRNNLLVYSGHKLSDAMLADSFPSVPPKTKQTYITGLLTYRQALRDITKQADPANITWPQEPII